MLRMLQLKKAPLRYHFCLLFPFIEIRPYYRFYRNKTISLYQYIEGCFFYCCQHLSNLRALDSFQYHAFIF